MSLRDLPKIEALSGQRWQLREDCLDQWNPGISAASQDENTISILGVIGDDDFGDGGVSPRRVAAALRAIGDKDVVVNINSPGGSFFDGVSIYNYLREHKAKVTVRVLGQAASAASVIAMAGDEIQIGQASFLMVHNAWTIAIGNRHDMSSLVGTLESFDASMAKVYASRSGVSVADVSKMMDDETYISGESAVEMGFADDFLPSDQISEGDAEASQKRKARAIVENALRAQNPDMSRKERRALLSDAKVVTPRADDPVTPGAGDWTEAIQSLTQTLQKD